MPGSYKQLGLQTAVYIFIIRILCGEQYNKRGSMLLTVSRKSWTGSETHVSS